MNRIYKVIWSKVKNCYIVVSEIAKSHSKPISTKLNSGKTVAAVLAALALVSVSGVALVQAVDVKLGDNAGTSNYVGQVGSIAIGNNSYVENMGGTQESLFSFGQTDQTQWAAGISIGQNAYARTGSVMLGDHKYVGALGDTTVEGTGYNNVKSKNVNIFSTTVGANSYNQGAFSTVNGAYSIISGRYNGGRLTAGYASQNFGAVVTGALNSIESATTTNRYSGIANSIVGTANRTFNSNGALVFGAGNEITNSTTTISAPSSGGASAKELQTNLMTSIRASQSGGATLAIGGGNKADYTQKTSIIGVNNTVTGKSSDISQYNNVTGFNNTATNVDNATVIGTNRTLSDLSDTIVIGSADSTIATTASNAVAIGSNSNVTVDGGVALGSDSVASVDKGVAGTVPTGATVSDTDKASATWTSTLGAVSVGVPGTNVAATQTRQITGVAAGTQATDAVNVAQLNAVNTRLTNTVDANKIHFFHVNSTSGTNYDNDGAKGTDSIAIGKSSTAADNSIAIGNGASVSDSNGGKGSGDIAIGNGAKINNYVDQSASIAIGQNAQIDNMTGMQEMLFAMGQTDYNFIIKPNGGYGFVPADPSKVATAIAIGENTFVRTGGLMIGTHNYRGALGDVDVDSANIRATGVNVNSTTLGTNSYNSGAFATIVGAYSIASGNYASGGGEDNASKNLGATIVGSLNSVESSTAASTQSGMANSVVGVANRTFNSNGSLIFGAGNEITNSVANIASMEATKFTSAKAIQTELIKGIKAANSGGSTLAIGGGNTADYTLGSALIGVNNTLKGTESDIS
ncbi:ESPR-type extended signal peptide-containing protein [Megasphaera massiliensis]